MQDIPVPLMNPSFVINSLHWHPQVRVLRPVVAQDGFDRNFWMIGQHYSPSEQFQFI